MSPKPIYWKPRYGTRSSRHRALVRRQAAREETVKNLPRGKSLLERLRSRLSR